MEPSPAIISEVTTVFDEALSIAESVNDMVHLQDQSTVMGQVTQHASKRDKVKELLRTGIESIGNMSLEGLAEDNPANNDMARMEISNLTSLAVSILVNELGRKMCNAIRHDQFNLKKAVTDSESTTKEAVNICHQQLRQTLTKGKEIEAKRNADRDKGIENLKSTSWDGSDEKEVAHNFLTARKAVIKANGIVTFLKEHIAVLSSGINSLSQPEGEETEDFKLKKAKLEWARSMLEMQMITLYDELSKGGDGGQAVYRTTETTPKFPLMDQMDYPPTDRRIEICKSWQQWADDPATIKEYCYIIHEFRYMVQAVDPREATHRKPPDVRQSTTRQWKEPVMEWNAVGSENCTGQSDEAVLAQYKADRKMQWAKLYSQMDLQATEDMRRFMSTVHEVGQYTRTSVNIKTSPEGSGFTMIWTMLAMLVDFNWQKQVKAVNILNTLSKSWKESNAIGCIESIRSELDLARRMGVVPSFTMSAKPLMLQIQNSDIVKGLHLKLNNANLTTTTMHKHEHFDAADCSKILAEALEKVHREFTELLKADDDNDEGSQSKKRKSQLSAMQVTTDNATAKGEASLGHIKHLVKTSINRAKTGSDGPTQDLAVQMVQNILGANPATQDAEQAVEAMQMTLMSGTVLSEPTVRKEIKNLKGGKGSKGGKGGKGGKGSKGKGGGKSGGKAGRGEKPTATSKGRTDRQANDGENPGCRECSEEVGWSYKTNEWFRHCKKCSQNLPGTTEAKRQKIRANRAQVGSENSQSGTTCPISYERDGQKVSTEIDANVALLLRHVMEGGVINNQTNESTDPNKILADCLNQSGSH